MTVTTNNYQSKRMPRQTLKKQAGLSFLGVFALVSMLMFMGLFAFKVVPSYVEFMTVSKIADDLQANPEMMKAPKSKVIAHINAAFRQNNLWDLKAEETILLSRDGRKGYKVQVDYEKRANLLRNIFVVTQFKKDAGQS